MRKILLLLAVAFFLHVPPALAGTAGMEKPAEVAAYVKSPTPYGQGALHKMFLHVYDSSLWTDAKPWSINKTFALVIRYDMNFSVKELVDRSIGEMERTGKMPDAEKAQFQKELTARFHAVRPGDVITAVYSPKKGGIFYYNGKQMAGAMDGGRAQKFLNIWLGPETSEAGLRKDLLALN